MTEYVPRDIAAQIQAALAEMPVVVLTGLRQTGKSTFLRREPALGQRRYATLDDFAELAAARGDPDGFVASGEPLTIDEAHKCPELLTAIKLAVDRRRKPGHYLLSGSANFPMLKGLSETLAGRAIYFNLLPFTRREMRREIKRKPFLQHFLKTGRLPQDRAGDAVKLDEVLTGGMPAVCLGEVKDHGLWFRGYEQTYLERDVRELSQVGNIISFRQVLHLAALRTGQLLSQSQLGRDARLNVATTSKYLSLLEASFVLFRLPPYLRNRASRLIKSPKVYLTDSGLAAYLAGIKEFKNGFEQSLQGPLLETYVAQNLAGLIAANWPEAELFFWNVQGRHEVDFVIEAEAKCVALEIKSGTRWTDPDLAGLNAFLEATPHCAAAIIATNRAEVVKLGKRLWAMPLCLVLS